MNRLFWIYVSISTLGEVHGVHAHVDCTPFPSEVPTESQAPSVTIVPRVKLPELPSATPTESPAPSPPPSETPTQDPSSSPTTSLKPSVSPSSQPTIIASPTPAPSSISSSVPTTNPSGSPSKSPTPAPSDQPSGSPSSSQEPSVAPSMSPSAIPSDTPSLVPSSRPTQSPSNSPSAAPSKYPSMTPSTKPSSKPSNSIAPSTLTPSDSPSKSPTPAPSHFPSFVPTTSNSPSSPPSVSLHPSSAPSPVPSQSPSDQPSGRPSSSQEPSVAPSMSPSAIPSDTPSLVPSSRPTQSPTNSPSAAPSEYASMTPSTKPSSKPSASPSGSPSLSMSPSVLPSSSPTASPSAGIRRHQADASVVLNGVSGAMSDLTTAVFETVTLRMLIDLFPQVDDLSIDFFYVRVTNQNFVETGGNRKLQEDVNNGQVTVVFKVAADVMPGDPEDFNFQWVVETFLSVHLDELSERLEGASGFFQPQQVQGSGSKNDASVPSNEENGFSTMRILVGLAAAVTVIAFVAGTLVVRSGRRGHDSSSSDDSDTETPAHSWNNFHIPESFSTVQAGNNRDRQKSEHSNFDGGDEGFTSCGADLTTLGSYSSLSKEVRTASSNETASSQSRRSRVQMRRPGSNVIFNDMENLEGGGYGEHDQNDSVGPSDKLGTRLIKRLIERESEENGDAAGISMEAILFASSSLSYNENSSRFGSILTMEERAAVTTIPMQGSPRDGSVYFDSSRISVNRHQTEEANSEKKASNNGTRQIFGSRLATWFTGKPPATNDEGDPLGVVAQQTTTNGSLQANINKMRDSSDKNSGEKWNALPTKKQSKSTLKKGRIPSALDLHLAEKIKIPFRGDGSKSPNWNEWDCPAGVETPRAEDYDIEESPPKKEQDGEEEHASKNLKQKIRDKFRKSRSHEVKVDTYESDMGENATKKASKNQHISDSRTTGLTSPRKLYRVNKEGRLVPNREFQASSPIWVSGDTDQVMGFVHSARKPDNASLASTESDDSEVESPMFSYPPPTLFQFLSEEEPDAQRSYPIRSQSRSYPIRSQSRTQQGRRRTDPPTVPPKRDPSPSVTTRSRKSSRRNPMMEMSVENNEDAVILGSVDKTYGDLELEWGNTI